MASLAAPHWEAVVPDTRQLLQELGGLPDLDPFYLAGGTALALHLGHRISQDLDLFASVEGLDEALRERVIAALQSAHAVTVLQDSPLGLVLDVEGLAAGLFTYGYPVLEPMERVHNVQVCGVLDIGLMKLDAIAGAVSARISMTSTLSHSAFLWQNCLHAAPRNIPARAVLGCACSAPWWILRLPTDRTTRSYSCPSHGTKSKPSARLRHKG